MKFILIATFMAINGQEPVQLAKITPSLIECTNEARAWADIAVVKDRPIVSISCSEILEPKK